MAELAALADTDVATWMAFEETGRHVGAERVGRVAVDLGIGAEALLQLDNPLEVLGAVWGVDLGNMLRESRGQAHPRDIAAQAGVSSHSLVRWERAQTHPRNAAQLGRVLAALGISPVEAVKLALWPPQSMMVKRPPLGEMLLAERTRRGLSTRGAALVMGAGQATYAPWERGRSNPDRRYWPAVAEFLGITEGDVEKLLAPRLVDTHGLPEGTKELVTTRLDAFLTMKALSKATGLGESTLASYEAGKQMPKARNVANLARGLGQNPVTVAARLLNVRLDRASFGDLLRVYRLSRGELARETASALKATHTQIGYWEANRALPKTDKRRSVLLRDCASHFGVDVSVWSAALERTTPVVDPFASWLATKMSLTGVTCRDLASHMGVRPQDVRGWMWGHWRPGPSRVATLAGALSIPEKELCAALAMPRV